MAPRTAHLYLPDNAFAICHICGAHADKEENEISRHYRSAHRATHPMYTGRGKTPYNLIKLVPQQVAEDLVGHEKVVRLNRRGSYTAENTTPKSGYASIADMTRLYGLRGLPVPAWVATFVWPPVPATPAQQAVAPPAPPAPPARQARQHQLAALLAQWPLADDNDDDEEDANLEADEPMADADDDEAAAASEEEFDAAGETDEDMNDFTPSKTLPAIMPRPGMICDHQDPSAAPGETVYTCLVHKRQSTGPSLHVAGNLRSMYDHYNQWHPETLRQGFHNAYDALYIEELITRGMSNRELADAAAPVIEGSQTLRCYVCMGEAESFEELDRHYREEHEDERWSIAEGIFDQWTHWEGVEGPILRQGDAGNGGRDA